MAITQKNFACHIFRRRAGKRAMNNAPTVFRLLNGVSICCLLALTGTLLHATPVLDIDATRVDLSPPDVMVGLESREVRVRLTSSGTSTVNLASAGITGSHFGDFSLGGCAVIGGVRVPLMPGETC